MMHEPESAANYLGGLNLAAQSMSRVNGYASERRYRTDADRADAEAAAR